MSHTKNKITSLLLEHFKPVVLEVKDDSDKHQEHIETELDVSHLNIYIVSEQFEGQGLVQRQRAINTLLQPFFDQGLHAVQLNTRAPSEING